MWWVEISNGDFEFSFENEVDVVKDEIEKKEIQMMVGRRKNGDLGYQKKKFSISEEKFVEEEDAQIYLKIKFIYCFCSLN